MTARCPLCCNPVADPVAGKSLDFQRFFPSDNQNNRKIKEK
jgi:hypothetical protein